MTFSLYGLTAYDVQYWNNSTWVTIPGGSVTGNDKVWRKFTFSPITTSKIRVLTNASVDGYSRITEVEAYGPTEPGASAGIKWLVADHLGTPRMIFDQSGDLANITRHDYQSEPVLGKRERDNKVECADNRSSSVDLQTVLSLG